MDYTWRLASPLGGITLASDGDALCGLWFDGQKYFAGTLSQEHAEKPLPVFDRTVEWLELYFSGKDPSFTPPLQMRGSAFQCAVWNRLLEIPYGQSVTYGELARRIASDKNIPHMSARAVGAAVGRNAISLIIPCHRVVGADGSLTGYAGGLERKQWLLSFERANSV